MESMCYGQAESQDQPDTAPRFVIAIDVSKETLDWRVSQRGKHGRARRSPYDSAGFEALAFEAALLRQTGPVWFAFEPTGPYSICLRDWLLRQPDRVVQVNPYHVKRTREVRDNSPSSSDAKSTQVIADLVWQGAYQRVEPLPERHLCLRALGVDWRSTNEQNTRLRNELQGLIAAWFPEMGGLFRDVLCKTGKAIIRRYASAESLGRCRLRGLEGLVRVVSRGNVGSEVALALRVAASRSVATGVAQGERHRHMLRLVDELERLERYREDLRARMAVLLAEDAEAQRLLSIPGVGVITVAIVLGECGPLSAYGCFGQLAKHVGLQLFQVRSGKARGQVHITKRGRSLARHALCAAALGLTASTGIFRAFNEVLRGKGSPWMKRRVAIARKLLRLMHTLARKGEEFDPTRHAGACPEDDGLVLQGTPRAA